MALLMAISIFSTYFSPEISSAIHAPKTFADAVVKSLLNLLKRDRLALILLFILFYKLGDAIALALMSVFLLKGVGFSLTTVGLTHKTFGLLATILGAFVGGAVMTRISLFKALFWFGVLQAFSNLMFVFLALAGKNYGLMAASIFIEAFCSGMGTAAFMAFLMALCDHRYTATQFALLSCIASMGRVFIGPIAAVLQIHFGWVSYFAWSFVLSFPGLFLLFALRNKVRFNAEKII